MAESKTRVPAERLFKVLEEEGARWQALSGWNKVDIGGHRIYIPMGKSVSRVDISAFTVPHELASVVDLGGRSFGNVRQQLDFSKPEEEVLRSLREVVRHARTLPPISQEPRKPQERRADLRKATPRPKADDAQPTAGQAPAPDAPPAPLDPAAEAKARRRELIKRLAMDRQLKEPSLSIAAAIALAQRDVDAMEQPKA